MELEIKDETFFVLETKKGKSLFDTESEAIKKLRVVVQKDTGVNAEEVSVIKVNIQGEKWEMAEVPWSKIAIELLKAGV